MFTSVILLMTVLGCSWFVSAPTNTIDPPKIEDKTNVYPFETREPEIFAADLFVTSGTAETRTSYARKNDRWRLDIFEGTQPSISRLHGDNLVQLDHRSKTFAEIPQGAIGEPPSFIADMNATLLISGEHAKFEKTGTAGSIETYTATLPDRTPVTLTYDASQKIIMKQEISSSTGEGVIFEIRSIRFEVDDSIFAVPADYRKVEWKNMVERLK